jgi:FkbM family methyltransferase
MKNRDRLFLILNAMTGDSNARSLLMWKLRQSDTLLYKHTLQTNALVYDVGGYLGGWTSGMLSKYSCEYHVFEPHPEAFSQLVARFAGRPEVNLHQFALGSANGSVLLSSAEEGSSIVSNRASDAVEVKLVDVRHHLNQKRRKVALMKLNIEGAEFDLLEALLWSNARDLVDDILVQFHAGCHQSEKRYGSIAKKLRETHRCMWRYAFLWELWQRIEQ